MTKLKEAGFWFSEFFLPKIVKTLNTITSEHNDFKQVSIHFFQSSLVDVFHPLWAGGQPWMVFEDALVKLLQLHQICVKVILYESCCGYEKTEREYRESLEKLLPNVMKMMKGGIQIELGCDERSELPPFPSRSKRSDISNIFYLSDT